MRRAGFWIRVAATLIDLAIVTPVMLVAASLVYFWCENAGRAQLGEYLAGALAVAIPLAYSSSEVWPGRTPGKWMLGLRITYPDGSAADRWTLLLRWSTKYFGYLLQFACALIVNPGSLSFVAGFSRLVTLVGCLQALDEDKRTWHDQWARTAVIRRPRVMPSATPPTPPGIC